MTERGSMDEGYRRLLRPRDPRCRLRRLYSSTTSDTSTTTTLGRRLDYYNARPWTSSLCFSPANKRYGCAQRRAVPCAKYVLNLYVIGLLLLDIGTLFLLHARRSVGWSTAQPQPANQGFGQPYAQPYDQQGIAAGQDIGVKGRIINLISAVRTLMRSAYVCFAPPNRN